MARKLYSLEYQEQTVALVLSDRSIASTIAKKFGLADQTIRNWSK